MIDSEQPLYKKVFAERMGSCALNRLEEKAVTKRAMIQQLEAIVECERSRKQIRLLVEWRKELEDLENKGAQLRVFQAREAAEFSVAQPMGMPDHQRNGRNNSAKEMD
jgi:hypothetical protein